LRRFLVITLCILFSLSLLSDYSIANTLVYVDIRPPKSATPGSTNIYLKPGEDAMVLFRVESVPALGSLHSFSVTVTYSGESFSYNIYSGVTNPNSTGRSIQSGDLKSPTSFLFPWSSSFVNDSGQKVNLASPVGLRIRNTGKKPGTVSIKIDVNESIGGLVVTTNPSGANVFIDNNYVGTTPLSISGVKTGSHVLKLSHQGYTERQRVVIVRPHQYEYISETLTAPVNTGSLYVDSTPRGASIYLDNSYEGETPRRIDFIPAGLHTLRLSRDGYRDYVQQVRIDTHQTTNIQINLIPETTRYNLTINSTPRGARVYVDGIFKGTAPISIHVTPGYHSIRLDLEGYMDYQDSIRVTGDTNLNISLQIGEGALVVFSEPLSADVYVDDKYYGRTPITIQRIPAGRRIVTVRLQGYADWSDEVIIEPGEISQINVKLKLAGTLQVSSSPSGAKVYLDGKDIGETPLSNSNIPEGTHNLRLELFGYRPWQGIIEVSPGRTTNIFAKLDPSPIGISDIDISPQPYRVKTLFKRDLSIKFSITRPAMVTVEIRDINDKLIATPMSGFKASTPKLDVKWRGDLSPGNYKVVVIAIDEEGNQVDREAMFRAEEENFLIWILAGLFGILILWSLF